MAEKVERRLTIIVSAAIDENGAKRVLPPGEKNHHTCRAGIR